MKLCVLPWWVGCVVELTGGHTCRLINLLLTSWLIELVDDVLIDELAG